MKRSEYYIIGSGGHAKEIKSYLDDQYDVYFVNNDGSRGTITTEEYSDRVNNSKDRKFSFLKTYSILGIGNCQIKRKIVELGEILPEFGTIKIGATANSAKIGSGCVLAPGSFVANNARIGNHVLVNYNATVGHDTKIGDYSIISPNSAIGGFCTIGEMVYVGSGSCIRERLIVGENTIIGMGAVVTKSVPSNSVVVGNPGKIYTIDEWERKKEKYITM